MLRVLLPRAAADDAVCGVAVWGVVAAVWGVVGCGLLGVVGGGGLANWG